MEWHINWLKAIELALKSCKLCMESVWCMLLMKCMCLAIESKWNVNKFHIFSTYMFELSKCGYWEAVWTNLDAVVAKIISCLLKSAK